MRENVKCVMRKDLMLRALNMMSWVGRVGADVRNVLRFLVVELRERNCLGDAG
jgi:hypothetical protein